MWSGLAANFAVSAFFVGIWAYFASDLMELRRHVRNLIAGLLMAAASICSMSFAVDLGGGAMIDLRAVPVAVAGFLAGPLASAVALLVAAAYRLALGGPMAGVGVVSIAVAALTGLICHYAFRPLSSWWQNIAFSLVLAVALVGPVYFGAYVTGRPELLQVSGPLAMFNLIGGLGSSFAIRRRMDRVLTWVLFRAAVRQAPSYLYIKDRKARMVGMNQAVYAYHGAQSERALIGKTDLDLTPGPRGAELYEEELSLIESGRPLENKLEHVTAKDGRAHWFRTSKSPISDVDNVIVGLVGITEDVTEEMARRQAMEDDFGRLSLILSKMADGVALYDFDCRLVFCNERYHEMFPMTRDVRTPGTLLETVLRQAVERGEQSPGLETAQWVAGVVAGMKAGREEEVPLVDGRALLVRNRPVEGIGYVSVVSDITEIRRTERRLALMTEQLKVLATTDALTGLTNRRALDEALEREVLRSRRTLDQLSVVMVDVDHFKRFNDLYGHIEGDRCLQAVARVLRATATRVPDIVARFGGEEFCLVLPGTDEEGAYFIADAARRALMELGIPHADSEAGVVTASFGLASYNLSETGRSAGDLLVRADQALYTAKASGRNRVYGWSNRTTLVSQRVAS